RVRVITEKRREFVADADVVTNSGHVRPLDAQLIDWMKPSAVIPLMYESWELRPGEVDLDACRRKRIRGAATNERHPDVDVLSYLGVMAVKLLVEAGVAIYRSNVLIVCDNAFAPFLRDGLTAAGALVEPAEGFAGPPRLEGADAVLIAL